MERILGVDSDKLNKLTPYSRIGTESELSFGKEKSIRSCGETAIGEGSRSGTFKNAIKVISKTNVHIKL